MQNNCCKNWVNTSIAKRIYKIKDFLFSKIFDFEWRCYIRCKFRRNFKKHTLKKEI